jgi:hypothetical protein
MLPKLKTTGGIGFLTLASGMHDPKIEMTLRHMMDGTIELDENLNMKLMNMPMPVGKKEVKLKLGKTGFSVE